MVKQEVIKTKTSRKGTIGKFFTTFSGQTSEEGSISYLLTDIRNQPLKIIESNIETYYERNSENNFVPIDGINVYSGHTIINEYELIDHTRKINITNDYIDNILIEFSQSISGQSNHQTPISYVQFEDVEIDDMFINININRSIDILDTLNVYNVPINEGINNESKTGVLIGRLTARQKILDNNGEILYIPLRNTPVAIFNSSEEFPEISSTNEEGNRITLNIKENITIGTYFNDESLATDLQYLTDTSSFKKIPDKFKHTAITNENGEFVLFNIPVGEQTFMYEVDLLKQGLTHDEVALNFGPYPVTQKPVIDEIPHFFYRQAPVNIVPSWGDFQTGYTQLNLTVNLDLRKWVTYYISPITYNKKRIEEQLFKGDNTPLIVQARDMTKKGFDLSKIEMVKIDNLIEKDFSQILEWENEVSSKNLTTKSTFLTTDYHVVKLPANMYDPNGTNSKGQTGGVWLGGYQLKMFYKDSTIYRATGFESNWVSNNLIASNHFELNKGTGGASNVGQAPYDRPWSINYPEPYKIPAPPTQINTNRTFIPDLGWPTIQTEPKYLDGDMAGGDPNPNDLLAWGYGVQQFNGIYTENIFARRVTQNKVYKYEEGVRWDELYSNGYNRYMTNVTPSHIINAERFQRVEAGFGYWLKPEGWPRIRSNGWGDTIAGFDLRDKNGNLIDPIPQDIKDNGVGPWSFEQHNYKMQLNDTITLRLDSQNPLKQGALDIFRIINPEQVLPPEYFAQETFVDIDFVRIYRQDRNPTFVHADRSTSPGDIFYYGTLWAFGHDPSEYNSSIWQGVGSALMSSNGVVGSRQSGRFGRNEYGWPIIGASEGGILPYPYSDVRNTSYKIKNTGTKEVELSLKGNGYIIPVNDYITVDNIQDDNEWKLLLRLPGNSTLRGVINKYTRASYEITIASDVPMNPEDPFLLAADGLPYRYEYKFVIDTEADSLNQVPHYYLRTRLKQVVVPVLSNNRIVNYASYDAIYIAGFAFVDPIDGGGNSQDLIGNFVTGTFFDKQPLISIDPINFNQIPYRPAH